MPANWKKRVKKSVPFLPASRRLAQKLAAIGTAHGDDIAALAEWWPMMSGEQQAGLLTQYEGLRALVTFADQVRQQFPGGERHA